MRPTKQDGAPGGSAGPYKWIVVATFWLVYFVNQADRQVIFSVFPLLQRDLGLSNTHAGILCSGALAGYIGQMYGWRLAFMSFGGAGILAAFTYRVRSTCP